MGLTSSGATLVAPQPKGIVDPATGKPVGANDPFFGEIDNELADKGFLVTSTDELITWAKHGPRLANVTRLQVSEAEDPHSDSFVILPTK